MNESASPQPRVEKMDDQTRSALMFLVRGVFLSLLFLGVMRLGWVERAILTPFTNLQASLAETLGWTRAPNTIVDLSCSGSDVIALCLGAVIAYPVSARARLVGCIGGLAIIIATNTARIGTLWHMYAEPEWFDAMHVYVWPAVLMVVVLVYLLTWIELVRRDFHAAPHLAPQGELGPVRLTPRFLVLMAVCVAVFVALSPLYLESQFVLTLAGGVAGTAVGIANLMGVHAVLGTTAVGSVVTMNGNSFLVTQSCIVTPLIPVGVAIALSLSTSWARRSLAVVALVPLFGVLAIVRLLVLTVPPTLMPSVDIVTHAFLQLAVAPPIVILAAIWRFGTTSKSWQSAGMAIGCTLIILMITGGVYTEGVHAVADALRRLVSSGGTAMFADADPQGALAMLPAYQLGLFTALWLAAFTSVGWKRFGLGLALLAVSTVAGFVFLSLLANNAEYFPNVRYVRAWAVGAPVLVAILMDQGILFRSAEGRSDAVA